MLWHCYSATNSLDFDCPSILLCVLNFNIDPFIFICYLEDCFLFFILLRSEAFAEYLYMEKCVISIKMSLVAARKEIDCRIDGPS